MLIAGEDIKSEGTGQTLGKEERRREWRGRKKSRERSCWDDRLGPELRMPCQEVPSLSDKWRRVSGFRPRLYNIRVQLWEGQSVRGGRISVTRDLDHTRCPEIVTNSALFHCYQCPGLDDHLDGHPIKAYWSWEKTTGWEGGCCLPKGEGGISGTTGGLVKRERRRWIQGLGSNKVMIFHKYVGIHGQERLRTCRRFGALGGSVGGQ